MSVFDKFSGIGVASGFKLQAKAPLDARQVVDTIDDRNALITENGAYEGMQVYVKADKKTYCLKDLAAGTWEEVGAGGGGSSTQADYAQNDNTKPDYIKNRPFYDEAPTVETILDLTFSTITASGVNFWATNTSVIQLTKGDTVKVVYNGVEYTQVVKELNSVLYFGNIGLGGLSPVTDEPFLVANIYFPDGLSTLTPGTTVATSEEQTNATIKITKEIENVKTIDPKYIKDMYYENVIETELYNGTLTTTQESGQSYYSATLSPYFDLGVGGDKLSVVINGVETILPVVSKVVWTEAGSLSLYGISITADAQGVVTIYTNTQYTNASIVVTNIHSDIHSIPQKYVNINGYVLELTVTDLGGSTIALALKTYLNAHPDEIEIIKKSTTWQLKLLVQSGQISESVVYNWQTDMLMSYANIFGDVNLTYTSLRRDVANDTDTTIITTERTLTIYLNKDGVSVDDVSVNTVTILDSSTWSFGIINSDVLAYNGLLSIYRMQSYGDVPIYFNGSVKLHDWITKAQERSDFAIPTPTKATDLVDKQYVDGLSGGSTAVEITSSDAATSGTLTAEQLATLQASNDNYIVFNNEIYRLADKQHTTGILSYTHNGWNGTAMQDKSINITISTLAWTLVVGSSVNAFNVSSFTITPSDITDTTSTVSDTTFYALTDDCKTRLLSWFNAIDFMKIISATSTRGSTSTSGYGTNLPVRMTNQGSIQTIQTVNDSASHLINVNAGTIQGELVLLIKAQADAVFSLKVISEV